MLDEGGRILARRLLVVILWVFMSLLWGTMLVAPLRVFGEATLAGMQWGLDTVGVSSQTGAWMLVVGGLLMTSGLLWMARTRYDELIAGLCGLIGTVWYLANHYKERLLTPLTAAVLIGLAALLIFLLLKWRIVNARLGEMFALAPVITVWMNLAVLPQLQKWKVPLNTLPAWSDLSASPLTRSEWLFAWPSGVTLVLLALLSIGLICMLVAKNETTDRR